MTGDALGCLAEQEPLALVAVVAVVWTVGYLLSLTIHPWTKCAVCNGKARHYDAVFSYAFRPCRACGGSGRKPRLGVRVLGIGRPLVERPPDCGSPVAGRFHLSLRPAVTSR